MQIFEDGIKVGIFTLTSVESQLTSRAHFDQWRDETCSNLLTLDDRFEVESRVHTEGGRVKSQQMRKDIALWLSFTQFS